MHCTPDVVFQNKSRNILHPSFEVSSRSDRVKRPKSEGPSPQLLKYLNIKYVTVLDYYTFFDYKIIV